MTVADTIDLRPPAQLSVKACRNNNQQSRSERRAIRYTTLLATPTRVLVSILFSLALIVPFTARAGVTGEVGFWPFEEGTGTTTADISGSSNTGTLTNSPTWTTGKIGNALSFNGGTAYVAVNGAGNLADLYTTGMTITAWIKPTGLGRIIDKDDNGNGWFFSMYSSTSLEFAVPNYSTSALIRLSGSSVTLNTWQHVAVTWDGSSTPTNVHFYVNGSLTDGTATSPVGTLPSDAATPFTIGNRHSDLARGFNGAIDDLRVYNRVLSATDIQTIANDAVPPSAPTPPIVATPSSTQVNLSWTAATDNVAVAGYRLERCPGAACTTFAQMATPTATTYTDSGLASSTSYSYRVRAVDTADNLGAYYGTVSTNTSVAAVHAGSVTYGYDAIGRLQSATYDTSANVAYTLDAAGNRTQVSASPGEGFLQFSQSTYSISEAGGSIVIPVTRTGSAAGAVAVSFATGTTGTATSGSDFTATAGTLSWADGDSTNKTISVPITNDNILEGNETFPVTLSAPTGGAVLGSNNPATVTIIDNDSVQFNIGNVSVNENAGTATLTVTKVGAAAITTAVNYATANGTALAGTRYTAAAGTLTFAPTDTVKTIPITIIDDTIYDGNGTFTVSLSSPTNGTTVGTGTGTVTIIDNEVQPQFSINSPSANEGATMAFIITRTGSTGQVNAVTYKTIDGTATAPGYYNTTNGTATFAVGDTTQTISTGLTSESNAYDVNKTFTMNLSAPTNLAGISQGVGTATIINPNPPPEFTVAPASVLEGGTLVFTIQKVGATNLTHSVTYGTSDGTAKAPGDYTSVQGTLTYLPSDSTKTVNVVTIDDSIVEPTETLNFTLSNPTNNATVSAPVTGSIIDNDSSNPTVPQNLRTNPNATAQNNYTVLWDASGGTISTYQLDRARDSGFTTGLTTSTITVPTTSMAFSQSSSDVDYWFRVRACNASNVCSANSSSVQIEVCGGAGCTN